MTRLTIRDYRFRKYDQWFMDSIRFLASLTTITTLHIEINAFSIDILISFLQLLPNLDALIMVLTNPSDITPLTQDQIDRIATLSKMNQITKVNVEQHVLSSHIDILTDLCLQMQFLRVHCRDYSQMEDLLRLISMRKKSSLESLCFVMPNIDGAVVRQLQTFIVSEKLLEHYQIQCMGDQIALCW